MDEKRTHCTLSYHWIGDSNYTNNSLLIQFNSFGGLSHFHKRINIMEGDEISSYSHWSSNEPLPFQAKGVVLFSMPEYIETTQRNNGKNNNGSFNVIDINYN